MAANRVVEAYIRGKEHKEAREERTKADEARKLALEEQKRQFDEQLKLTKSQHDIENARLESTMKFTQAIQELHQQNQIAENYAKYGIAPAGSKVTKPKFSAPYKVTPEGEANNVEATMMPIPTDLSGIPHGQAQIETPNMGIVNAVTPEESNRLEVERLMPQLNKALALERAKTEGDAFIKQLELQAQIKRDATLHTNRMEEIGLQNKNRIAVQNLANENRLKVAQERARISGKNNATIAQLTGIVNKFNTNPIVEKFNILNDSKQLVDSINNDELNTGAGDIALVYAFVKAQDPNAVKEGEVKMVEKYNQSVAQRFKISVDRVLNDRANFLSEAGRKNLISVINAQHAIAKKSYDNFRTEHGKQIKNAGEDPDKWLPNLDFTSKKEVNLDDPKYHN